MIVHMKRTFATFLLTCSALVALAVLPSPRPTVIAWDYPTNDVKDDLTFYVFMSTNLAVPMSNWTAVATVVATNTSRTLIGTNFTFEAPLNLQPAQSFFVAIASNQFWGKSDFSSVASTPPVPRSDISLQIR